MRKLVLSGGYREIEIDAAAVPAGDASLTQLHARLRGVHAPLSQVLGPGPGTVIAAGLGTPARAASVAVRVTGAGMSVALPAAAGRRAATPRAVTRSPDRVRLPAGWAHGEFPP